MPYKSKAQEKWAHTEVGQKALGGPAKVAEWDKASKGKKLPARLHPHKIAKTRYHFQEAVGKIGNAMKGKK